MHTASAVLTRPAPTPTARQRETWIDVAKGMAILLIVFTHSGLYLQIHDLPRPEWWGPVDRALTTVRLPTFFLISGLFMRNSLKRTDREFVASKVAPMLWLYLLWTFVWGATIGVYTHGPVEGMAQWVQSTLTVTNGTWYLIALPFYYVVWRASRNWSPMILWPLLATVSLVFSMRVVTTGSWGADRTLKLMIFFFIGAHFPDAVRWIVRTIPAWAALAAVPLLYLAIKPSLPAAWMSSVRTALFPLLAVPVFLVLARLIDFGRGGKLLRWLGKNTLPIYVIHMIALELGVRFIPSLILRMSWSLVWAIPFALTAFSLLLSLAIWRVTRDIPGAYSLPTTIRDRIRVTPQPAA